MRYTIDRFENGKAVLLEKGNEYNEKLIPIERMPSHAKEGDLVEPADLGHGKDYQVLEQETAERRKQAKEKLEKLKKKSKKK
ncbi:MAG: DUF3006 domain-containing protein [Halobacillus sp.]|uniref:DUF3006 domain-containing protein n=1 Tax=Halobacillus sp. TaxID=56800 RepID=UPI003BB1F2B5